MNKNRIRLTESDLHRIVKESVNKVLKEERPNIHGVFNDRNKSFEEKLHRLGLTITDKEHELEALKKEYWELKEEWEEDAQNYNDRYGQYYGE